MAKTGPEPVTDERRLQFVNASGFPLQMAIAGAVKDSERWVLEAEEFPWRDPEDSTRFIDAIALQKQTQWGDASPVQALVIECKRARDTSWIFLRSKGEEARRFTRARVLVAPEGTDKLADGWADVTFDPRSPASEFCVIRNYASRVEKDDRSNSEILESTAAEVARATEAIAALEYSMAESAPQQLPRPGVVRVYTPVIVTTAELFVCDGHYDKVDLASGELDAAVAKIHPVPFVRFTKTLGAPRVTPTTATISDLASDARQTVIVVQARNISDFLARWELGELPAPLSGYVRRR